MAHNHAASTSHRVGTVAFDIAYQAIFDIANDRVFAYEALLRGPDGESADSVLAEAAQARCPDFDQSVTAMAIAKAVSLGLLDTDAGLAINVMPDGVVGARRSSDMTLACAVAAGLPPARLIFEFNENVRFDVEYARAFVTEFRKHGFRTALDDFGTGYSGLVVLADIATDIVKLDMALIRGIDSSDERRRIVTGVVRILLDLGRQVVAEGIETAGELAAMRSIGVDLVQGFYLGTPSRTALQCHSDRLVHAA